MLALQDMGGNTRDPKKRQCLVTAVITTYNRPELAKCAIRSVLAQTYRPLEIIVVEDGSSTGLQEWLQAEGLEQVRYVRHETNRGLAAARNTGLRLARGEYVAYLDDDDEWLPEKIARQVDLLERLPEHHGLAVVHCGRRVAASSKAGEALITPRVQGDIREYIGRHGLYTVSSSGLYRRTALERAQGHDETLRSHVDFDLWMKLAEHRFQADFVDDYLVVSEPHEGTRMMRDPETRLSATEQFIGKWFPKWVDWYGIDRAREYRSQFHGMVLQSLADVYVERKRFFEAARLYWKITTSSPLRIHSYARLRRFAGQIVHHMGSLLCMP